MSLEELFTKIRQDPSISKSELLEFIGLLIEDADIDQERLERYADKYWWNE